jgi:hypothetical protein
MRLSENRSHTRRFAWLTARSELPLQALRRGLNHHLASSVGVHRDRAHSCRAEPHAGASESASQLERPLRP